VIEVGVNGDGTLFAESKSPGTNITIARVAPGQYSLSATGLGNECTMPALTPVAGGTPLFFAGGGCPSAGAVSTTIFTANGQDEDWSATLVGVDPPNHHLRRAVHWPRRHRRK
jgi:hypothetical protein